MNTSQHHAVLIDQKTGQTFPLDQETITIGRKAGNSIVLDQDAAVSRRHTIITRQADRYMVQDAGSANGTYLNNQRLSGPQPLNDGDVLRLGQTLLAVQFLEEPKTDEVAVMLPPDRKRTTTNTAPLPTDISEPVLPEPPPTLFGPRPGELPIQKNLFFIQESIDLQGNYNIFDPESGQLLFKCMQSHDLVQSLLKTTGSRFDCWLRTPEDRPVLRIAKGLAVLTAKPIQVRDERDQLMGEIRTGRSQQFLFEVFDAIQELLFSVEQAPDGFRFTTGGLECASMRRALPGSFPNMRSGGEAMRLEISSALPANIFIRQLLLATAITVLLVTT
jgi:pSer/pThr/pTyr-binding forkhead associated (FHA) protein